MNASLYEARNIAGGNNKEMHLQIVLIKAIPLAKLRSTTLTVLRQ